ncbi:hypothetical protein [Verrucomicrobium sp. 3C]|uniref:hypothetical protein n=1 Tax=Verrucomicrobium sp. 3C TaxID=1134055 RepID=UPI00035D6B8D|nr:hypothetical protein [Verrucomicrobium sp. 3C]
MLIAEFPKEIFALLKAHRSPESYAAEPAVLPRSEGAAGSADDSNLLQRGEAAVEDAFRRDCAVLDAVGYDLEVVFDQPSLKRVKVRKGADSIGIEWVLDSAIRYFPFQEDEELGWTLSMPDLAVNKALTTAYQGQPGDVVEMIFFHKTFLPLAAIVWAANGKDPRWTPDRLLDGMRRHSRLSVPELAPYFPDGNVDHPEIKMEFLAILYKAEELVHQLPPEDLGCFYLEPGSRRPAMPDLSRIGDYIRVQPAVGGVWPAISFDLLLRRQPAAVVRSFLSEYRSF